MLAFGGMALKNCMVAGGGISQHVERGAMEAAGARGCEFVLVSPLRADLPAEAGAEWMSIIPGTDTALMLALAHTLVTAGPARPRLPRPLHRGLAGVRALSPGRDRRPAEGRRLGRPHHRRRRRHDPALARRLHGRRALIVVSHSLQRAEHGEQPVWMGAVLAAALGQIGLPGGGYGYALGAIGYYGRRDNAVPSPTLPQGRNGVRRLHPGRAHRRHAAATPAPTIATTARPAPIRDIRLVYWAGGNPFHHHQDLNRLRAAFARLDTLVVHELAWTATARHADIVLPCTMTLEREDIGGSTNDPLHGRHAPVAEPYGEARDDYAIFADLAERLGTADAFTEGRTARQWLEHLYEPTRAALAAKASRRQASTNSGGAAAVDLAASSPTMAGFGARFRDDPVANPLPTPSGKIEIFSETIAGFGEADCPGHPAWLHAREVPRAGTPLLLVANQPAPACTASSISAAIALAAKHRGREVARMHPEDAAARGIADGDIIRLFNARGACLAAVRLTEASGPAWFSFRPAPGTIRPTREDEQPLCVHGNPNVLTRDVGTSALAQGCTGQLTTVEVERFDGNLPPIRAYDPPGGVL